MAMEDKLLIIRRNDFLAQMTSEDYKTLNIQHNFIVEEKNGYIYFDAHYHNKLYFVKEGFVRIGNVDEDGNQFIRDILQPGDIFGQITLEKSNLQGEFAQAHKCDTILCAFTIEDFEKLLYRRPDLAIIFAKKAGQKVRRIENRLLNLLQKDVRTRLLYFFVSLLPGNADADMPIILPNYLTHEDIARLTGTSRQTVTTLINKFTDEGLLTVDRQNITINNIRLLQKEAKVG
jgi:CRP/FNR family transcriptional regulator